jgi:hypothetical protein
MSFVLHHQFDRLPPSCHDAIPRSANRKRGIHERTSSSVDADFMKSIVWPSGPAKAAASSKVFAPARLTIIDVERLPIHGGSLRLFVQPAGSSDS